MQHEDSKLNKREITYQIGWKKGRMEVGGNGKAVHPQPAAIVEPPSAFVRWMERTAWRPTITFKDSVIISILWCTGPVAFVLTWLLVYLLGQH